METPLMATLSNSTSFVINEMDQYIPKELQMPVGIAIGVLALVIIFGITKVSSSKKEVQFNSAAVTFKSPEKADKVTKSGTPINEKTGTVMTPAGRRSARLARRKED
eukprot:CAMPEP_0197263598 /NCGR_PEP_ID=MMETSP1432-20130617/1272_1 /TAXON_ID=44447 /ORGANISM="Pseudo-nitzschia delicatissima, Strain UNC1205" /LENGTH=106 /DNA_ID=CAMNT_0042728119 /DNA_START=31 /DNA_END=351 /DNA_ORIENTATION=+